MTFQCGDDGQVGKGGLPSLVPKQSKKVEEFKYLGPVVQSSSGIDAHVTELGQVG